VEESYYPNSIADTRSTALYAPGQNCVIEVVNTFDHGVRALVVNKKLAGSYEDWIVGESAEFKVKIKDTGDVNYLLFKDTPEADGSYWCVGNTVAGLSEFYDGATITELPVTAERPLVALNLWINHDYLVEEIDGDGYEAEYTDNGSRLLKDQNSIVTVVNMYEHGTGSLIIEKELVGSYEDWKIDENTEFKVKVKDKSDGNYLLFKAEPEADGSYWCVGNDVVGLSEDYQGPTITELPVSVKIKVTVVNLWINHEYEVEEIGGEGYTASYKNNGGALLDGTDSVVTVVNTYDKPDKPDEPGPNTGDNGNMALWLWLGSASLFGLCCTVTMGKKKYRIKIK